LLSTASSSETRALFATPNRLAICRPLKVETVQIYHQEMQYFNAMLSCPERHASAALQPVDAPGVRDARCPNMTITLNTAISIDAQAPAMNP